MDSKKIWPSKKDVGHMCDYITYHVISARAKLSKDILGLILEYLTSEVDISYTALGNTAKILKRKEKQLLSLLEVVPETHWDASGLLDLCGKALFHQVCGYIHSTKHQYVAALHSYMKIAKEPIHAFSFIHDMLQLLRSEEYDTFESAVISSIPDLIKLSREGAYFLITDLLSGKSQQILSDLHSQRESLFLFLKTVVEIQTTGTLYLSCLRKADVSDIPNTGKAHKQSMDVEAYLVAISNSLNHLRNNEVHGTNEMSELYFEVADMFDLVRSCIGLCQRNSPRLEPDVSEHLWFQLLDS